MCTGYFGEVVFPNEEVFMILPRRLVPNGRVAIRTPVCWHSHSRRLREDGGKLRGNLTVERFAVRIGRNKDVVASARELEFVNRCRTQRCRQLDCETMTGLI